MFKYLPSTIAIVSLCFYEIESANLIAMSELFSEPRLRMRSTHSAKIAQINAHRLPKHSGVTNIGVIRCGNWWCHIFYLKMMIFSVPSSCTVTTRTLSAFPADGLSSVLVNSAAKNVHFHSGVTPIACVTRAVRSPRPSSDATAEILLSWENSAKS